MTVGREYSEGGHGGHGKGTPIRSTQSYLSKEFKKTTRRCWFGKRYLGRGNRKCQGPEERAYLISVGGHKVNLRKWADLRLCLNV